MTLLANLLDRFAAWALSKNPSGPYGGSEDPRWAWTAETNGSPYLTRIRLPWRLLGLRPVLNRFHRQDLDRDLHNHPWQWALSIVLCGAYDETRLADGGTATRRVRWFNLLRGTDYHRVDELHGVVWTLFITGPKTTDGTWGFLVDGRHITSADYLGRGGRQEGRERERRRAA